MSVKRIEPGGDNHHRIEDSEHEPVQRRTSISFDPRPLSSSQDSSSSYSLNSPLLIREEDQDQDQQLLSPEFDDPEVESDGYDYYIPHDQQPLSPGQIIILLLAPNLRLGAFALPYVASSNLAVSISCLVIASFSALFVRHLWVILAHYVRKVTVEDITSELLTKFGISHRWRGSTKTIVRSYGVMFRAALLVFYVRLLVQSLSTVLPPSIATRPTIALLTFLAIVLLSPSTASTTSPRVSSFALLSTVCYVIWMSFLVKAKLSHDTRYSESIISLLQLDESWDSLTCSLLTYASFPPLSIYASLSKYRYPEQTGHDWKKKRRNSFGALSTVASVIAFGLTLPLLFLKNSEQAAKENYLALDNPALNVSRALSIFFAIPQVFSSLPRIPWPTIQTHLPLTQVLNSQLVPRALVFGCCVAASFLPRPVFLVMGIALLTITLSTIYVLPATLHVLFHNLFRPSAIVVSSSARLPTFNPSEFSVVGAHQAGDECLQTALLAKERRMQRSRHLRRLSWDLGAWALLLVSVIWAVGKTVRWWA